MVQIFPLNDSFNFNSIFHTTFYFDFYTLNTGLSLIKLEKDINNLGSYLAGLIEGDGSIYTPNSKYSKLNTQTSSNTPSIEIVFSKNDVILANYIINLLGGGYLVESSNYSRLFIKKRIALLRLINLINGEMRTPKIKALHRQILWCNTNWNLSIPLLSICIVPLAENAWLSGMMDADGSFYLNWLYTKKGVPTSLQYYVRLTQKSSYLIRTGPFAGSISNSIHMHSIANLLDSSLISYERKRQLYIEKGYLVRTAKISSNYIMSSYFLKYPLFSYKYVCLPVFIELYDIQVNKKYKNLETLDKLNELKLEIKNHSNSSHENHIIKFFYLT